MDEGNVYVHVKEDKAWIGRELLTMPKIKDDGTLYYSIEHAEYYKPEDIHAFKYVPSENLVCRL
jgi:hypothetical protein